MCDIRYLGGGIMKRLITEKLIEWKKVIQENH